MAEIEHYGCGIESYLRLPTLIGLAIASAMAVDNASAATGDHVVHMPRLAPETRSMAPPDAAPAKPEAAPAEKKKAKVVQTKKFGSHAGDPYKRGGRDTDAWIIGFDRTKGMIQGKTMIGMLEPVYERKEGEELETEDRIVAKEGYVVGQVELDVDTFLRAVRVSFYRLKDGKVDPADSYQSRWVGKRKNKKTQKLAGPNQKVVGLFGTADEAIRSIGLLVVEQ